MKLSEIAKYVTEKISSENILLENYITTDNLLPDKQGRTIASNLPPQKCTLTKYAKGDVLIANIRPYLKKIWMAYGEGGASNDVLVFRAKEGYDSSFVYAVLLQDSFYSWVMKAPRGSQMPRGDKNHIMNFNVSDVPGKENIGKLLSNLDRKIALNRQINTNLEALARQLYDYWFVQFDFPDANGKPYKSSGGKMTYNEKLKRHIPDGWDYLTTDKITNVITGKEDANFSVPNGKYPFFTCSRDNLRCATPAFSGKAVLIAGNGEFNVKHYTGEFNAYQRTYVLIPDDEKYYGVLYFAALEKIDLFKAKSNGSIIKFITKGDVENIGVFDCHKPEIYQQINTLIETIENNEREISSLTRQRDELLPLLMNGQVTIE